MVDGTWYLIHPFKMSLSEPTAQPAALTIPTRLHTDVIRGGSLGFSISTKDTCSCLQFRVSN